MKIKIEIDSGTLKVLAYEHIKSLMGDVPFNPEDIVIEVMSKQNYRQKEWERGDFRAVLEINKS